MFAAPVLFYTIRCKQLLYLRFLRKACGPERVITRVGRHVLVKSTCISASVAELQNTIVGRSLCTSSGCVVMART